MLSFALADACVPEPTDAAVVYKAIGYAVVALVALAFVGTAIQEQQANQSAVNNDSPPIPGKEVIEGIANGHAGTDHIGTFGDLGALCVNIVVVH